MLSYHENEHNSNASFTTISIVFTTIVIQIDGTKLMKRFIKKTTNNKEAKKYVLQHKKSIKFQSNGP